MMMPVAMADKIYARVCMDITPGVVFRRFLNCRLVRGANSFALQAPRP